MVRIGSGGQSQVLRRLPMPGQELVQVALWQIGNLSEHIGGTPQSQLDELLPWKWREHRWQDQAA